MEVMEALLGLSFSEAMRRDCEGAPLRWSPRGATSGSQRLSPKSGGNMRIDVKRIFCPTDLSPESHESLHYAIDLARLLQSVVPAEVGLWAVIKQAVKEGKPYREVLAYAEEREIDLICMGVRGARFGLRALFGSNTDRVLRQAPCPLLIARPRTPDVSVRRAAYLSL
jgi:hypothetical protein